MAFHERLVPWTDRSTNGLFHDQLVPRTACSTNGLFWVIFTPNFSFPLDLLNGLKRSKRLQLTDGAVVGNFLFQCDSVCWMITFPGSLCEGRGEDQKHHHPFSSAFSRTFPTVRVQNFVQSSLSLKNHTNFFPIKNWFFKGGSTQNRLLLMGDFSKGGSTQKLMAFDGWFVQRGEYTKPMAFDGWFCSKRGVHKTDGFWWVIFQRGEYTKPMVFDGFWNFVFVASKN